MITNSVINALLCALIFCFACESYTAHADPLVAEVSLGPISPIPARADPDVNLIALGRSLFIDARLDAEHATACSSCHRLHDGGDDNLTLSRPAGNFNPALNTPSIFNVQFNFRQNWDGAATDLKTLIDGKVRNLGQSEQAWTHLLDTLNQDAQLLQKVRKAYARDTLDRETYLDALGYYVENLTTPNARFDQYLQGNASAINGDELRGYGLFKEYGCISCHQGRNIGGNLFQRFGIFYDYFAARGDIKKADYGRMNITGRSTDNHVFKVPSLRNVALTAPYLHDGRAQTLEDTVRIMGRTQLGIDIGNKDVALIVKFLNTLSGDIADLKTAENNP